MVLRSIQAMPLLLLAVAASGCGGLSHTDVTVPPLEIRGSVDPVGSHEKGGGGIYIVVPEFYGETDAFTALLDGHLDRASLYDWRYVTPDPEGGFRAAFDTERRYIGFVFPFAPGRKTTHGRLIFLRLETDDHIYRVAIKGDNVEFEETDISSARLAWYASPAGSTGRLSSLERIDAEWEFYDALDWSRTSRIAVRELSRSEGRDLLHIAINVAQGM